MVFCWLVAFKSTSKDLLNRITQTDNDHVTLPVCIWTFVKTYTTTLPRSLLFFLIPSDVGVVVTHLFSFLHLEAYLNPTSTCSSTDINHCHLVTCFFVSLSLSLSISISLCLSVSRSLDSLAVTQFLLILKDREAKHIHNNSLDPWLLACFDHFLVLFYFILFFFFILIFRYLSSITFSNSNLLINNSKKILL